MRLWIHIAATILTVCDFTHGRATVNPFNDNGSKSKGSDSTSSEDQTVWNSGFNAEEFLAYVPVTHKKHFQIRGRKVAFQPSEPRCMKALRWLEDTHKSNITMMQKLIIYNINSCPEKTNAQNFCARNGIGHTRFFSDKCLQCAKGCKDVLGGGTRYISRKKIDCEEAVTECEELSCPENARCVYSENGYRCLCPTGYGGPGCDIDIDECASSQCQNGATCLDEINGYRCDCLPGYEGINCKVDINECASSPCQNEATCIDEINGYRCNCAPGFEGINCEVDIDECASSECQNGAACIDEINRYRCNCVPGYEGTNCKVDIDECLSSPCQNGATCLQNINRYRCNCAPGFQGANCKIDINECSSSPCQNGATCIDRINGYVCSCTTDFQGTHCEFETNTAITKAQEIVHCVGSLQNAMEPRINCTICGPSEPLEDYRSYNIPVLPTFSAKNFT